MFGSRVSETTVHRAKEAGPEEGVGEGALGADEAADVGPADGVGDGGVGRERTEDTVVTGESDGSTANLMSRDSSRTSNARAHRSRAYEPSVRS